MRVIVVGAGLFGLTGARALAARGHAVRLLDPGPIPHPDSASSDVSKGVRADYGADRLYSELAERAIEAWPLWDELFGERVYHATGMLVVTEATLEERPFEYASYRELRRRGFALERIDGASLARRFPAWGGSFVDGYFNPRAGWVASGRVIHHLARLVRAEGLVEVLEGVTFDALVEQRSQVVGVQTREGAHLEADIVLVAAGAWTPALLPWLADRVQATAQPTLQYAPSDPSRFRAELFPVWAADVTRTGWYGFPILPNGRLKIARHGPGRRVDPTAPRAVTTGERESARAFLRATFPDLAEAPQVQSRSCLYCDTFDSDFWLDHDPDRPGLVVAAGGSGHAFKFAPLLGELVADAVEGRMATEYDRWRWRTPSVGPRTIGEREGRAHDAD